MNVCETYVAYVILSEDEYVRQKLIQNCKQMRYQDLVLGFEWRLCQCLYLDRYGIKLIG